MNVCPDCGVSSASKDGKHYGVHFAKLTDQRPCPKSSQPIPAELRSAMNTPKETRDSVSENSQPSEPVKSTHLGPKVYKTMNGTPYLKECSVSLISEPLFNQEGVRSFIESYDGIFDADDYINDLWEDGTGKHLASIGRKVLRRVIDDGAAVAKFAGQLCYLSFGSGRTKNVDAKKYFDNIKESKHGSVLEHANYTLLVWGIDRSCTHEIVRHRAGFGFSQVSQRYVSGKTLRFVERPEYQDHQELHFEFEKSIERAAVEYNRRCEALTGIGSGLSPTEARKAKNQAARAVLPNETEAPIVITANVRAWRHFIDVRGNKHADLPIRGVALAVLQKLREVTPILFDDYEVVPGVGAVARYPKV